MSGDALRQVFASFGFEVDDKDLNGMLEKTEAAVKLQKQLTEVEKAVLAEVKKTAAGQEKAADEAKKKAEKDKEEAEKKAEDEKQALHDTIPGLRLLNSLKGSVRMRALGLAAGIGAVVVAAHQFAAALAADAMALRESADAARVTEQQFQQLIFAGAAAGVSAETTASAVNTLAEGLRAIESRTGGPTNALWRLGVRARETDGRMRGTNDVLYDLADRFERVRSPVHRARLAQELFGSSGRRMLQVLAGGSAALRRQAADFTSLGGGVLPEAVEESRRFTMAQTRMGVASDSLRSVFATFLLPIFTRATNTLAGLAGWFSRMTRGTHILNFALVALGVAGAAAGVAVVAAWLPVLAPIAAVVLSVVALSLAFDDIQNLMEGNNSLIGHLIDQYAGFGAAARFVERIRDAWNGVVDALVRASEAVDRLPSWAQTGVNIATFGLRGFLPQGRAGGTTGDERTPTEESRTGAAPPPPPRRGSRRAPAPAAPAQPMMPQANVDVWAAVVPQADLPAAARPATTAARGREAQRTINDHRVTNNSVTVSGAGNPQEVTARVIRALDERERRRREAESPASAEE